VASVHILVSARHRLLTSGRNERDAPREAYAPSSAEQEASLKSASETLGIVANEKSAVRGFDACSWAIAQVRRPRRRAAADRCFQRLCLQPYGSQLAILPALLPALCGSELSAGNMLVATEKQDRGRPLIPPNTSRDGRQAAAP
jgi:hypothetical protein